jgi:hypothetical protein
MSTTRPCSTSDTRRRTRVHHALRRGGAHVERVFPTLPKPFGPCLLALVLSKTRLAWLVHMRIRPYPYKA